MKAFVDVGFNRGEAFAHFRRELKLGSDDWQVWAIEPNPACHGHFPTAPKKGWHYMPFAAWTEVGWASLRQDDWRKRGGSGRYFFLTHDGAFSSIMPEYKCESLVHPISVPTLDFAEFLKPLASYEEVVVKMSVSGAEFELLRHMLAERVVGIISELHLEIDHRPLPRESRISEESLIIACEEHTRVYRSKKKS